MNRIQSALSAKECTSWVICTWLCVPLKAHRGHRVCRNANRGAIDCLIAHFGFRLTTLLALICEMTVRVSEFEQHSPQTVAPVQSPRHTDS